MAAIARIEKSKADGYFVEALFKSYHLNLEVLRFLSSKISPATPVKDLKPKELLGHLIQQLENNSSAKSVISKKNLKAVKPWLVKMDAFFRSMKLKQPANTKAILAEGEKIFALLNISAAKLHASGK